MAKIFESLSCARCGGTGAYSFNQKDGHKCYGCSGSGSKLTKRGKLAQDFYRSQLAIMPSDIKVGMRIKYDLDRFTVTEINKLTFKTKNNITYSLLPDTKVYIIPSEDEKLNLIKKSLEYQKMLTKSGLLIKKYQAA